MLLAEPVCVPVRQSKHLFIFSKNKSDLSSLRRGAGYFHCFGFCALMNHVLVVVFCKGLHVFVFTACA